MRPLRAIDAEGLTVRESIYRAASPVPAPPHDWATLCLALDGGYQIDCGRTRFSCGPASLALYAPGEVCGGRISDLGSHCLTVAVDPALFGEDADAPRHFGKLNVTRRTPPHWLAFQLLSELRLADSLSPSSMASTVFALLGELSDRPALEARRIPLPWLQRVRDQIDDEFRSHHTLERLAYTAGVHRVHLARQFHRQFGCTVGHYIRQRRIEFACHRLTASEDPLPGIALDAGFADQSHLTNTFRRMVGMPPGAFRARFTAN